MIPEQTTIDNKTLAVCGDSWFSSDLKFPGHSFGEVLADKNHWKLLSLARGGCSNFTIALQVDKAIELKADFVIVGITTPDRIEIPMISDSTKSIWDHLKSNFNWGSWGATQPSVYDTDRGLSNIQYAPHPDLSSQHEFLINPTVISESMNNLAFRGSNLDFYSLTSEQIEALKLYMLNLYDFKLKTQIDSWIISDACRRLINLNVPFLIVIQGLLCHRELEWVPDKNKIFESIFNVGTHPTNFRSRFHYHPDDGIAIANYVDARLKLLINN
jgi:hypothetical protein